MSESNGTLPLTYADPTTEGRLIGDDVVSSLLHTVKDRWLAGRFNSNWGRVEAVDLEGGRRRFARGSIECEFAKKTYTEQMYKHANKIAHKIK
jgi:hypothetical protein